MHAGVMAMLDIMGIHFFSPVLVFCGMGCSYDPQAFRNGIFSLDCCPVSVLIMTSHFKAFMRYCTESERLPY